MKAKQFDVVRLRDGRSGTILDFYEDGKSVMLEIADKDGRTLELPVVSTDEILEIVFIA